MDLFEEALRRWEEALTFRGRQAEDEETCAAIKTGAGDAIAEHSMEVSAVEMTLPKPRSNVYIASLLSNKPIATSNTGTIQALEPISVTGFRLCNSSHASSLTGTPGVL